LLLVYKQAILYIYSVKLIFYFLLVTLVPFFAWGQQPAYFVFGEKEFEGIDIYDIIQDRQYNYIIASDQGLVIHDGYSFNNLTCPEMKSASVFNLLEDGEGTIYCHNLNHQIFKIIEGKMELFFEIPEKGRGADITILNTIDNELIVVSKKAYLVNKSGKIISSTESLKHDYLGQPFLFDDGTIIISDANLPNIVLLKNRKFYLSKLDLNDKKLNGNNLFEFHKIDNQTYAINLLTKTFYKCNQSNKYLKKVDKQVVSFSNEHLRYYTINKQLWIASNVNGLAVLNKDLNKVHLDEKIFKPFFISNVYQDREGNILLTTFDKGILVIPDLNTEDKLEDFKAISVSKLIVDEDNSVYFGTNDGAVIHYKNKQKTVLFENGNKSIETIYKWPNKPFILSDNFGLTIVNTKSKKTQNFVNLAFKCAVEKDLNSLYIGSNLGVGILNYNTKLNSFTYNDIESLKGRCYAMQFDEVNKLLYLATIDGIKIVHPSGKFSLLEYQNKIVHGSILTSINDKIYIATKTNDLLIVSKGKVIKTISPVFQNKKIKIHKLQFYKSKLYANTSKGLVIMDLDCNIETFINKSTGLTQNKIIDFKLIKNKIWVVHSQGVQVLQLNKLNNEIQIPLLLLNQVKVNDLTINERTLFNSDEHKFMFNLQVPTLKNRDHIYYHFKLEPIDKTWSINPYSENKINYNVLSPGKYTFKVKAENNGKFSQTINYTFTIRAPFYLRWWFSFSLGLILIFIVSLFYKNKLRKQKLKSDLINELNASKLIAIQSQMNPHFIFNSMNSIQDLVLKGDVANSYTYITKFSNLVRRTLSYSDKDFINFEQEIKLIELYLSLEKLRFKESLTFSLETNDIEDLMIPPMLIQPFIENALLHGLLHKEGERKLSITFNQTDTLICEIIDNGIGREKSKEIKDRQRAEHESFAVGAIKKRFEILSKHYPGKLGFTYIDLKNNGTPSGTKVILNIPIRQKF
jgi:ligand-binding sensor domain-containing protein